MCGIAGLLGSPRAGTRDPLGRALGLLVPRGPDTGARIEARLGEHAIELGVRRLALVQPQAPTIQSRPSGALLVFNGEIYNHGALRRELEREGVGHIAPGDGAVLLALLEHAGMSGLSRIEGSYAFAYLRGPEGPLWLGRDPLGVRPLLYARTPGGIAFSSTLDALLGMALFGPMPDLAALVDVLRDGAISGCRTAVRGVRRVAPGEVVVVGSRLELHSERIPASTFADHDAPLSVLEALRAAVRDRLALDRPIGLLLSGGVDSGLLAALAAEHRRIPAFTLGWPGVRAADEIQRARTTAQRLGMEHHVVPAPADPTAWVLGTARAFDEPFADASAVPTWGVAREAGRSVRALLSGTGGDEVFGGYRRYWLLGAGPWLRHVPDFVQVPLRRTMERRAPGSTRLLRAAADPQGLYRGLLRLQPLEELRQMLGPLLRAVAEPEPRLGPRSAREAMQDDLLRYLPEDLLAKEDRALMAHGVEGRHPYLDARVRRAAAALELRGSPFRGKQKEVLRAYVRQFVDPDLARVPKRGFAFPVDEMYRGPLRDLAEECLLGTTTAGRGFVDGDGARRLLREHLAGARNAGAAIHALVMLELWSRRVMDAAPAPG